MFEKKIPVLGNSELGTLDYNPPSPALKNPLPSLRLPKVLNPLRNAYIFWLGWNEKKYHIKNLYLTYNDLD